MNIIISLFLLCNSSIDLKNKVKDEEYQSYIKKLQSKLKPLTLKEQRKNTKSVEFEQELQVNADKTYLEDIMDVLIGDIEFINVFDDYNKKEIVNSGSFKEVHLKLDKNRCNRKNMEPVSVKTISNKDFIDQFDVLCKKYKEQMFKYKRKLKGYNLIIKKRIEEIKEMKDITIVSEIMEENTKILEKQNELYFQSYNDLRDFVNNIPIEKAIFFSKHIFYTCDNSLYDLNTEFKKLLSEWNLIMEC